MNESGSSLGSCEIVQAAAFVGASLSALVALSLAMGFYVQKCSVKDAENGAIPDADQVWISQDQSIANLLLESS